MPWPDHVTPIQPDDGPTGFGRPPPPTDSSSDRPSGSCPSGGNHSSGDYTYQIQNFSKAYAVDDKYGGTPEESFEMKFMRFAERCDKAQLPTKARSIVFSDMLKGSAADYYFMALKNRNLDINNI